MSHVTSNRGAGPRQVSANSSLTGLKRSHSVKSNFSQRKASWGGRSSVANKENEAFPEEEELPSGDESDAATERRTSYTGSYADSMVYGTASAVSADRKTSLGSFTNSQVTDSHSAVEESVIHHDEEEDDGQSRDEEYASASEDDAQTTKADDEPTDDQEESVGQDADDKKLVIYGQHSDSGLGTEITSGA